MRADLFLTVHQHAASRAQAKRLIEGGHVRIDGCVIEKASADVPEGEHTVEVSDPLVYVGRGGWKLEAALDAFGMDVTDLTAVDIGASTGGFTDCLLQRGARHVWAVDSGSDQLAPSLRRDMRVTSMEHCNARYLTPDMIGGCVHLIVMDVSFISATYLIPRFPALLEDGGDAVCLIKPQFEVGKSMIGKSGIVKDAHAHRYAVERVLDAGRAVGLVPVGLIVSPVTGGDGNREFLVRFTKDGMATDKIDKNQIRLVTG